MIRLIVEKELKEIIGSTKFALSFGVCAILILLTFYVGARNQQVNLQRYEAAQAENLRKMEGLTDWMRVRGHRIFLPPQPLEALVNGISNDIGRTVQVSGRGELAAVDSRYNDDPIFAVFRFLDLDFVFQIVLSLFAILFTFNAVNGEKELGTLRLSFANPLPKDKYIIGKWLGAFLAVGIPLFIPILLGCLILPLLGVFLSSAEWVRLALIILAGLLYFSAFLTLGVFTSVLTKKSSTSFLLCLVIWILAVLIIPRASVLLAGRAVDVPSTDELAYQKTRLRRQLWNEDMDQLSQFKPDEKEDPQKMIGQFNQFMQEMADERNQKLEEYSTRLNENRQNKQFEQQAVAFNIARLSPAAAFSLAASTLAGTSLDLKNHFLDEAAGYQSDYAQFMKEKTGMNLGGDVMIFTMRQGEDEEEEKPIDTNELPKFNYRPFGLDRMVQHSLFDLGLLVLFNIIFFLGGFVRFLRYDLR